MIPVPTIVSIWSFPTGNVAVFVGNVPNRIAPSIKRYRMVDNDPTNLEVAE